MNTLDKLNFFNKLAASSRSRQELEKELKKAKKVYEKASADFERAKSIVDDIESKREAAYAKRDMAHQDMIAARNQIADISDFVRNLDLTGASGIKSRGDENTYLINDKEYHVDLSDLNDIKYTPWKEYKNKKKEDKKEDSNDINDANDFAPIDEFDRYFTENHLFSDAVTRAVHILKSGK